MTYYAIDCETTGLDPEQDRILEIAIFNPTTRRQNLRSLIAQPEPIPTAIKALTLIDDDDVRGAPAQDRVIGAMFDRLLEGTPPAFVAHNAEFDKAFVVRAAKSPGLNEEYGIIAETHPWICTFRLARHLCPESESHALMHLRYHLGLKIAPAGFPHRARYDAEVCWHVWQALRERLAVHIDPEDARAVVEWQNRPCLLRTCAFGKHRGEPWDKVPKAYLKWMQKQEPGSWDSDTNYTIDYYLSGG